MLSGASRDFVSVLSLTFAISYIWAFLGAILANTNVENLDTSGLNLSKILGKNFLASASTSSLCAILTFGSKPKAAKAKLSNCFLISPPAYDFSIALPFSNMSINTGMARSIDSENAFVDSSSGTVPAAT